ncbi:putative spermidine/putrescine transport system substrate-binding protein [Nonomuraea solani]|uniref:Putative spermidine/putrescine transport system substrate-binding protein n=1 Tax=Nonomuraea solani TaxID=1144553 RepID=A0A1H6EWM8_9ACTN|nr:ABC transporter substrate-binding protein [Nonomuraea solani]SEH01279.1 putative spermidine/putrescine transport system substrate-binding protein [Nonomuraea solani]
MTRLLAAALALIGLTACAPPSPAASPGKLVVAGYGGSYQEAFEQAVLPAFEKTCGCEVTYIAGSSTDTVAKLKAQQAAPQIDVALIDDGPQAQAVQAGLLAKIDPAAVTRLAKVEKVARLPGDVGVGFALTATGLAYNSEWYAKNGLPAPTKLSDLADPKLKGKVVLPSITNTYGVGALMLAAREGDGSVEAGFAGVKKVAANAFTFDTTADVSNYFLQGQAVASVWGGSRVETLADKDFPIKFVYPEKGAIPLLATANVVDKAPHPDLAQKFVNALLEPGIQRKLAAEGYDGPTVSDAALDAALAGRVVGPEQAAGMTPLDWKDVNGNRAAWTDRWTKEVEQ